MMNSPVRCYIVRCKNGSYTVVSLPEMIDAARERETELTSVVAAQAFAERTMGVRRFADDYAETQRIDGHARDARAFVAA